MHDEVLFIDDRTQRQIHEKIHEFFVNPGIVFLLACISQLLHSVLKL